MTVSIERRGSIALVTIENPPVNALSQSARRHLLSAVEELDEDQSVKVVVLTGAGRTFIAGADVSELGNTPQPPYLPELISRIENANKPWIAAINGAALGGGLEIALGCRFRFANSSAQVGLPEVSLGLVPGAGGTVRLPRLIGAEPAVEIITGGRPISAADASKLGILDEVVSGNVLDYTFAFVSQMDLQDLPARITDRAIPTVPPKFWEEKERQVLSRAKGEVAPLKALACVKQATKTDFQSAMAFERRTFIELLGTEQAKALRHVFFAERRSGRPDVIKGIDPRPLRTAAVVGAGTMGIGIAAALREAKLPVILVERDEESLERGLNNLRQLFEGAAKRGRISFEIAKSYFDGVTGSITCDALGDTDLVVEAVIEDLEVKQALFERLGVVCRTNALLATNTSYLDPAKVSARTIRPERVLGLHFFSPANVMKLVEIIPTPLTAQDVTATAIALARRLGKIPVRAGICEGFIGNRILKTTRAQAERALLAGASPAEVDVAMRAFGMPMGPFEAQDLGGLDIAAYQRSAARMRGDKPFAPVADRLFAMGRYGQKSGGGWYDYAAGDRTPRSSQLVAQVIAEEAAKAGQPSYSFTETDLADLIVLPMINEAACILEEGIAGRASDIDLVQIHGFGFPRWRGGLMYYGQTRGFDAVKQGLSSLHDRGLSKPPCPLFSRGSGTFDTAGILSSENH